MLTPARQAPPKTHSLPGDRIVDELGRTEPESDFAVGRLGAVAAVDQVVLLANREISTNGARRGGHSVRRSEHRADDGDRLVPFEHSDHDGAAGDEPDQPFEEWLALVLGVMALTQRAVDLKELQRDDAQSLRFEALEDLTDETALDAVGLEDDKVRCMEIRVPRGTMDVDRSCWPVSP